MNGNMDEWQLWMNGNMDEWQLWMNGNMDEWDMSGFPTRGLYAERELEGADSLCFTSKLRRKHI